MALIKKSSIEDVVGAADMVELVSARTQLRRVGSRWTGRCPFHEERTPSFSVNPVEKLFYCFGCSKGGDLITFVRETEGLDFAGAVEWLADRYRIALEYEETSPRAEEGRRRRDRLFALLEAAAIFYSRHLWETEAGESVRTYLAGRGLGEEVCRRFRLGLSPGGSVLAGKARAKGYTQEEVVAAGLVNRRGNDYFSGRLVFPLADARGRVLGFGARRLVDEDPIPAKYVNSPEGELFRKGAIVYGLHDARAAIAKEDRAIVVEGYTDVLALHQAGLEATIASMGTALTEAHLRELRRLTRRLYFCFDADAAGEEATLRGMDLAYRTFEEIHIVPLPQGADPASIPEEFGQQLDAAEAYPRYRVTLEIKRASSKKEAYDRIRRLVGQFDWDTEWLDAVKVAAERLDFPPELSKFAPAQFSEVRVKGEPEPKRRILEAGASLERRLLAACAAHPQLVERYLVQLDDRHFDEQLHRRFRAYLVGETEPDRELLALRAELDATAEGEHSDEDAARELFLALEERVVRRELAEIAGGDPNRLHELRTVLSKIQEALQEART